MGMKSKIKRFFELEDDVYDNDEIAASNEYEAYEQPKNDKSIKNQNVVSLTAVQKQSKVLLLEPRTYDEAQDIADELKNRKAVIINLQRMSHDQAKRVVDFLSGTVYAIGGDIQKIGPHIFLCTPDNVDVAGSITEMMQQEF